MRNVVEECKKQNRRFSKKRNKAIAKDKLSVSFSLRETMTMLMNFELDPTKAVSMSFYWVAIKYVCVCIWEIQTMIMLMLTMQWRHSKWDSMMEHRLQLTKKLLSQNGFIICAIDDNELFVLGLLMDDIFGEIIGWERLQLCTSEKEDSSLISLVRQMSLCWCMPKIELRHNLRTSF